MIEDSPDKLDLEIKRLERDKRLEEIRQLRTSGKTQWITPTALAALLPLLAGLGVWLFSELKQLNAGYAALANQAQLQEERDELRQQKDSLNNDVLTLLALKKHYVEESQALQARFEERQQQLDATYLRARFASTEANYALGHVEGLGPGPDGSSLRALKAELRTLPTDTSKIMTDIVMRYELAVDMIEASQEVLTNLNATLALIPVSNWAAELQFNPSGAIVPGRRVLVAEPAKSGMDPRYYDVDEGRFLTEAESR